MKVAWSSAPSASSHSFLIILTILFGIAITTGCGSSGTNPPKFSGNTTVVILASSTANDQLFQFSVTVQSLTLTDQSGQTVSLLPTPVSDEFIHLNGHVEPLATVRIPQVSKTAPFNGGCSNSLTNAVNITPTFKLTSISIAAQPTNSENGKVLGVEGLISSVSPDGSGFAASALSSVGEGASDPTWQVVVSGNTTFQGVGGAAGLTAGMVVDTSRRVRHGYHKPERRFRATDGDISHRPLSSRLPGDERA